jgi:hypothetical protein
MKRNSSKSAVAPSPAKQVAEFVARFDPAIAKLLRAARSALRKRLPTAVERVYDNYNSLAIGFCSRERTSDCIVSLAASAKGVALSFYNGASLPDPDHILLGSGRQNCFMRLESAEALTQPAVEKLIRAAAARRKTPLPAARGYTMIKLISAKQRPRRLISAAQTNAPSNRSKKRTGG